VAAPRLAEKGSHVSQQLVVESTSWLAFLGTSRSVFVFALYSHRKCLALDGSEW